MCPLADDDCRALLALARRSIAYVLEHRRELAVVGPQPDVERLEPRAGAFVTLRREGRLRGCVGQVESFESLEQVVAHCAAAAATEDPRFEPVRPADLPRLSIEISILSLVKPIALGQIVLGKHGLVITCGRKRGVLLPRVPMDLKWNARQFLEETCLKAGLERKAWLDPETRIEGFTAEAFSEEDFAREVKPHAGDAQSSYSSSR